MKKNTVTKRTWNKNVNKFANAFRECWKDLDMFVATNTKGKASKKRDEFRDRLCDLIDKYIILNCNVQDWCFKNKVNQDDFISDVINSGITTANEVDGK